MTRSPSSREPRSPSDRVHEDQNPTPQISEEVSVKVVEEAIDSSSETVRRWQPIPDCGGRYYVSDVGDVRSADWRHTNALGVVKRHRGRILKRWKTRGYPFVILTLPEGGSRTVYIHQLVCAAFCGPKPFPGAGALHWDDNPDNNDWTNLRWGTDADNALDRARNGLSPTGSRNGNSKLTEAAAGAIRADPRKNREIAAEYGVHPTRVSRIKTGQAWQEGSNQ